jgi:UDP-N-acetylmuramate dehydrogenase
MEVVMMPVELLKSFALTIGVEVFENEPMSRHTTFKIGGPADIFIAPKDEETFFKLCAFCSSNNIPLFVLGNGSNLLVSDKGIRGVVIKSPDTAQISCDGETLTCGAGEQLIKVCEFARDRGLSGLEFAYGIPGTVGGAVYMNAGAYGGEMKDVVAAVSHIDGVNTGSFKADELCFGYRHSVYSGTGKITRVTFALHSGDKAEIGEKMRDLMERRRSKQPLEWPSAGSVFKRPQGNYAGTLIESCGLKGAQIGGAAVSEKHAGFIINTGGATCRDVLELVSKIQNQVLKQTGITLECEIRVAGEI